MQAHGDPAEEVRDPQPGRGVRSERVRTRRLQSLRAALSRWLRGSGARPGPSRTLTPSRGAEKSAYCWLGVPDRDRGSRERGVSSGKGARRSQQDPWACTMGERRRSGGASGPARWAIGISARPFSGDGSERSGLTPSSWSHFLVPVFGVCTSGPRPLSHGVGGGGLGEGGSAFQVA